MPWEAYQTQALGSGGPPFMSEAPEPQDSKSMILVLAVAGADLAEIVVAAEVDVVIG